MDVFILVLLPAVGLFVLTRSLLDPKKNRFRQAQTRFTHDVMKGCLPPRKILAILAHSDKQFDPWSAPDAFARRYGSSITCRDAVRRALLEEQIRKQRRDSVRKHQKLADRFKAAKAACALPWKRAAKGANVLGGIRVPSLEKALTGDVLSILKVFSATSQGATGDLGRIWQALMVYVSMRAGSLQECESQIADAAETALRVPQTIEFMHSIDRLLDTHCTPQLASVFVKIVSAAALCCTDSAVAEALTTEYDYC